MSFVTIALTLFMLGCQPNSEPLDRETNTEAPGNKPDTPTGDKDTTVVVRPESPIRTAHPRLFFTSEDIPLIRSNAAGEYRQIYSAIKDRVDYYGVNGFTFNDPLAKSGEYNTNHEAGFRVAESALVYVVTGDSKYLEYTKKLLGQLIDYYRLRVDNNLNIAWYAYSQVCALCAYDWIYNDLTIAERNDIGKRLYDVMYEIGWHGDGVRQSRYRENISDSKSGCYGINILPWYQALAFYGTGVNDMQCKEMYEYGLKYYQDMVAFRSSMAGRNGGGATGCVVYSFGYYPVADFCYIYTSRSALGKDISGDMSYVLKYLDYLDWMRLPGNMEFGFGDTNHYKCNLPVTDINYHIAEIANLYGVSHPEVLPRAARLLGNFSASMAVDRIPFIRLLHKTKTTASASSEDSSGGAVYFDTMGQVVMRSGVGENDTYAMFVSGGVPVQHKHYDNNHFIIYRNGYRALDSGSRPEPGQHLFQYFSRTVAHNCVTIRMPGEVLPKYWGELAPGETEKPVPNDGGQRELLGSTLLRLEDKGDYVYLASDATEAYSGEKASLVLREFVWCKPDLFVVFDRVVSRDAAYPKTWLFHLASEPLIRGNEFSETSQGGRTICRTLFPAGAKIAKIGGAGKQFWSDGQNWPMPEKRSGAIPPDDWPLAGQWRIEVSPGSEAASDYFMHIFQVGDNSLSELPVTETFENSEEIGVRFVYGGGKTYRLSFDKAPVAKYGCSITVDK